MTNPARSGTAARSQAWHCSGPATRWPSGPAWPRLPSALASLPVLRETSARPRPCPASATDQRSGGDREAGDAAPDANDAASSPGWEGRGEQGQAGRDDDRSPGPWAGPE
jgi:hypothetical protein